MVPNVEIGKARQIGEKISPDIVEWTQRMAIGENYMDVVHGPMENAANQICNVEISHGMIEIGIFVSSDK